jgi:hypothetical protein
VRGSEEEFRGFSSYFAIRYPKVSRSGPLDSDFRDSLHDFMGNLHLKISLRA